MDYKYSLYVDGEWVSNFNSPNTVEELQKMYESVYEGNQVCVWENEE